MKEAVEDAAEVICGECTYCMTDHEHENEVGYVRDYLCEACPVRWIITERADKGEFRKTINKIARIGEREFDRGIGR